MKKRKKVLKVSMIGLLILLIGSSVFLKLQKPSHDRNWRVDNAKVATTSIKENFVTISNVRDWRYDTHGPISQQWVEKKYDLTLLSRVWFITEPFSKFEAVGHAMLMFDFQDGESVLISIEARKEAHEKFSGWGGLWKQFEIICLWGTPEDFLVRRAIVQGHPLRMHQLNLKPSTMQELFLEFTRKTNEISAQPQFYHTLFSNCTNELAYAANKANPKSLPFTKSRILTGYADKSLYDLNLLHAKSTWEKQKAASVIHPFIISHYKDPTWLENLQAGLLKGEEAVK